MPEKNYKVFLNEVTRIVIQFISDKKEIAKFAVGLEYLYKNRWTQIMRVDSAHEVVHRDIIGKNEKKKKVIYYPFMDNKSGLNFAIEDFRENYEIYTWRFLHDK